MPVKPTYPGVYVEEVPSGVNTIVGVSTSVTAFVGITLDNPNGFNEPVMIHSFAEFEQLFCGLWEYSSMSYAVYHYFLNGGRDAIIVSVDGAIITYASGCVSVDGSTSIEFTAKKPGDSLWKIVAEAGDVDECIVRILRNDYSEEVLEEFTADDIDSLVDIINNENDGSEYVTCDTLEDTSISETSAVLSGYDVDVSEVDLLGSEGDKTGIFALDKADIFNILCVPPISCETDLYLKYGAMASYCEKRRAILLVDPKPEWDNGATIDVLDISNSGPKSKNTAIYFPMIKAPDPLNSGEIGEYPPSGAMAGVIARTDANRGIWKAPAGVKARIKGTCGLSYKLTDGENGELNPLGINCLRTFPVYGTVSWGARTLVGADLMASEWKYLSVRRVALYIEESLYRGLKWAVFESNDEPLWARMRLSASVFMNDLFRKGAFQGASPKEAYFVKCDKDTTIQSDINQGIVNIIIGFAPLKPAEFVIIKLKQIAGNPLE